jgi:hypothetical protein
MRGRPLQPMRDNIIAVPRPVIRSNWEQPLRQACRGGCNSCGAEGWHRGVVRPIVRVHGALVATLWRKALTSRAAMPVHLAERHRADWVVIPGYTSKRRIGNGNKFINSSDRDQFLERNLCSSVELITRGSGNGPSGIHDAHDLTAAPMVAPPAPPLQPAIRRRFFFLAHTRLT